MIAKKKTPKLQITHPGVILCVEELPEKALMALVWYMAIDGEAWELPPKVEAVLQKEDIYKVGGARKVKKVLQQNLKFFREKYGKVLMGWTKIPRYTLKQKIYEESKDINKDFSDFQEYHSWYLRNLPRVNHNTRGEVWPVILSEHKGETLQDGWSRAHHYIAHTMAQIPALYYPEKPKVGKKPR